MPTLPFLGPNDRAFIRFAQDLGFAGQDEAGAYDFIVGVLTDLGGGNPLPVLHQCPPLSCQRGLKISEECGEKPKSSIPS